MAGSKPQAYVLGGGVAGITAAFAALDRGYQVELCEAHRWLGGRAFSLPEKRLIGRPDNGPHVMLGCYRDMRAMLRRLGTESGFRQDPTLRLAYRDADGVSSKLQLSGWPTPLAFPRALLRMPLSRAAKRRAAVGLAAVGLGARRDWTFEDWIQRRNQLGEPRSYLWDPMCRAIMNAEADQVSARLFLSTLRQAFLGSAAAAALWLPDRPWSELVGGPALERLTAAGARVSLGARVREVEQSDQAVTAMHLSDGSTRKVGAADLVLSALPWRSFAKLFPLMGSDNGAAIEGSPIVSVYFELDQDLPLPPDPLIALVGDGPFHFLCRRPSDPTRCFALLSGGCRAMEDSNDVSSIEREARAQFARHFPDCALPADGRVRVVRESRATILATPGLSRPAPGPVGAIRNLRVFGDWTATGLPSTLEGAARSVRLGWR